ncbi:MAG: ATP-binding cassette domain-containing protein [Planctomycetaceae bacterium]|nr:ATP-binding cassette domain-containing protein [Planctomycetaceae bacterium]
MSEPILAVRDLVKRFPVGRSGIFGAPRQFVEAVAGVSFDLQPSQSLGLVGESGCGKSTTARAIAGLLQPTSGSVRLGGAELVGLSRRQMLPHRRRMQMVFQDPYASLDPRQSVESILTEPLTIHRIGRPRDRRLRALELLEDVGLSPKHLSRYPHEFSGGQRQRIGIARALALEPDVILLDEPVSALDVSIQAQVLNLLIDLQARYGQSYLFIAHDLAVVRHLCQRVAVMYLGRVVEIADRETLFSSPQHPYTRALLSAVPEPDPHLERTRQRIVLGGDVPSPMHPPTGCAFHPRCPDVARVPDGRCARERPLLLPLADPGRGPASRACHLPHEPPARGGLGAHGPGPGAVSSAP